jgi:hypothetical protein
MLIKNVLNKHSIKRINNLIIKSFSAAAATPKDTSLSTRFHQLYVSELERIQKNT